MKTLLLAVLCLVLNSGVVLGESRDDSKYNVTPTIKKESPTDVYIPKDLEGCFKELEAALTPAFIEEMRAGTEDDMSQYHRGLGMWMRNNWGLWSGSRLKQYFNDLGVHHPDDMSGIILTSFWRHLNNKPIQLQDQISYYQQYWKDIKTKEEKDHKAETPAQEPPAA